MNWQRANVVRGLLGSAFNGQFGAPVAGEVFPGIAIQGPEDKVAETPETASLDVWSPLGLDGVGICCWPVAAACGVTSAA